MLLDLVLSIALAAIFFLSGVTKLAGVKRVVAQFVKWGYTPSVRIAGGVLEVSSAAVLLVPGLTLYGALLLLGVLGTAIYTHVVREKVAKNASGAAILLVLVVVLGLLRGSAASGPAGVVFQAIFG